MGQNEGHRCRLNQVINAELFSTAAGALCPVAVDLPTEIPSHPEKRVIFSIECFGGRTCRAAFASWLRRLNQH